MLWWYENISIKSYVFISPPFSQRCRIAREMKSLFKYSPCLLINLHRQGVRTVNSIIVQQDYVISDTCDIPAGWTARARRPGGSSVLPYPRAGWGRRSTGAPPTTTLSTLQSSSQPLSPTGTNLLLQQLGLQLANHSLNYVTMSLCLCHSLTLSLSLCLFH